MLLHVRKMNKFLAVLFIAVILSLGACSTSSTEFFDDGTGDNPNVAFTVIARGQYSNISLPNELVIKSTKDWLRLLKINGDTSILTGKNSKSLAIDFDEKIVIAVFAGQQPSGGYSIDITNIKRVDNNLLVTLKFNEPGRNESVSLALTQPYIMVSTDQVEGKIIFLAANK